ncbi:GNAT family N-acetyltransferase [Seonamhaeicola sp.]|uniref:GNAT family N-acetyltransferase n=1 Tax=Seonamhaeicola sp. TaxID=1912245 RepID=UPI00263638F8|nr:GNAT family N-acetyltransferase [Seonamhaeicola sp.]
MNLQPTLENELIMLRPLTEADYDALYEVAKDPLIWEQHPISDRYKKAVYSDFFTDSINSNGAFIIIDRSTKKVIGSTRFKQISNSKNAIEIGWSFLSRDKWGGKYNKAMKQLMMDYAFQYVDHVIFYIGKNNKRSQSAVEKLGGKKITDPHLKHLVKENESDWTYGISKKNWSKST